MTASSQNQQPARVVQSMTGYAQRQGTGDEIPGLDWVWELRTVNNRGLDVKLRFPRGHEGLEPRVRKEIGGALARGSLQVNLTTKQSAAPRRLSVDRDLLTSVREDLAALGDADVPISELLRLPGMVRMDDAEEMTADTLSQCQDEMIADLRLALDELIAERRSEGRALAAIIDGQLSDMEAGLNALDDTANEISAQLRARLLAKLADMAEAMPEALKASDERIAQEVAMLCVKADVREEIDRLRAHIAAVRELLQQDEPIGRRLEFLAQELNREANTVCSKAPSIEVTNIGLALKAAIDQFREQVANIQ